MADEDDPELWLARSNRRAALRVLVVGLLVLVPSSIWLGFYHDWDLSTSPVTRVKATASIAIVIGAILTVAGIVMLLRRSKPRL
jgi:hypothetical protein